MENVIKLPIFGIVVTLIDGGGSITTTELQTEHHDEEDELYNAAMDGIESMILAHACAGIDITTPAYIIGIKDAVNACAHNY
jgi:hypothetical protein